MGDILERENHAVAFRIRLTIDLHFAVNHGHDTVTELFVDESLDGGTIDKHTLHARSVSGNSAITSVEGQTSKRR